MPRRSGTITVCVFMSSAASGPHISPVSPKPCRSTTPGPEPPERTKISAPAGVAIFCVLKPGGMPGAAAHPRDDSSAPQITTASRKESRRAARKGTVFIGGTRMERERRWRAQLRLGRGSAGAEPSMIAAGSGLQEREQVGVELVFAGVTEAVGAARVNEKLGPRHELRRQIRAVRDRHDLVVVAVDNERRHVELLEILGKVGFREGLDAVVAVLVSAHHALQPPGLDQASRT